LQVFENHENVVDFLVDPNDSLEGLDDQTIVILSKYFVNLESLFTRDNQTKNPDLKE